MELSEKINLVIAALNAIGVGDGLEQKGVVDSRVSESAKVAIKGFYLLGASNAKVLSAALGEAGFLKGKPVMPLAVIAALEDFEALSHSPQLAD